MGNEQTSYVLTEKDLEILVKTSGKSEQQIRESYNEFLQDSNNTGLMNKQQFKKYYAVLKGNANLGKITSHIFRAFDTDNSGTIDFNEFLLGYIATTGDSTTQKLEYAFEVYDINNDHLIEKKEASKILDLLCRLNGIPEDEAEACVNTFMFSFDTNRDKVITKQEFIDGCLHDPTLRKLSSPFNI